MMLVPVGAGTNHQYLAAILNELQEAYEDHLLTPQASACYPLLGWAARMGGWQRLRPR